MCGETVLVGALLRWFEEYPVPVDESKVITAELSPDGYPYLPKEWEEDD